MYQEQQEVYRHPAKQTYGLMALLLFAFFVYYIIGTYFVENDDPSSLRALQILLICGSVLIVIVLLLKASARTVIRGGVVELRMAGLVRKRFTLAEITGYRRCRFYVMRKDHVPLWIYQGEMCLGEIGEFPGMSRVSELLREQGCRPVFDGRSTPDRFRIGQLLRVEDGCLCRGRLRVPLRDVRVGERVLRAPDGRRLGSPWLQTMNADLLARLLVQAHKDLKGTRLEQTLL